MKNHTRLCEAPLSYCECCQCEIYSNDMVYNLEEIFMNGRYIVHEECLITSLTDNAELLTQFLLSDLCILQDIMGDVLCKTCASDIFGDWGYDEDDE